MMKRDQPKLSSIFARREGLTHVRARWTLVVMAELLALSTMILAHPALASDTSSPAITDGAAVLPTVGPEEKQMAPVVRPVNGDATSSEDLSQLMPLLVTAPEHMKLAAKLKILIEQGNLKEAERQLRAAVEVGTLAILLVDRLDDPSFLPALQALEIPTEHEALSASPHDAASHLANSAQDLAASEIAALQVALEEQRARAETSARDLAAATEELTTLKALHEREMTFTADQTSALQVALEQERMRADAAAQEAASVKDEYRSLREQLERDSSSTAAIFAGLQEALDQEKWRSDAVARQLMATLDEVRILRSIEEARLSPMMLQLERLGVRSPIQPAEESRLALPQPMTTGAIATSASFEQTRADAQAMPQVGIVQPAEPQARADAAPIAPSIEDRLVIRGEALFRQGDVSGARLLLQRAYEAGHSRATFILAETFDPHVLSERGVIGIRSDAARARELYSQALALNEEQASARLDALK